MMPFAIFASVLWWARSGALRRQRLKVALIVGISAGLVAAALGYWAVLLLPTPISTSSTSLALSWETRLLAAAVRVIWAQTAATAFALLGFALAPYAHCRMMLSLFLVVVPLLFVILNGVVISRFGGPSLTRYTLITLPLYLLMCGLSGWILRHERVAA